MKSFATIAAFAAGAHALAIRGDSCCFEVTASGGASGTVGQLSDGQNRIGGGLPPATYCISPGGVITDSSGRGCILTPPTTQWQCDTGATGTSGFSVNGSGDLTYNGNTTFVACQTGDNGELNIYTNPPSGDVSGCVDVTLEADKCAAVTSSSVVVTPTSTPVVVSTPSPSVVVVTVTETVCAASTSVVTFPTTSSTPAPPETTTSSPAPPPETTTSSPAPPPATTTSSASPPPAHTTTSSPAPPASSTPATTLTTTTPTTTSSTTCATTLSSGNYEYPHLIIPINSASPDTAYGTQYNGVINSTVSTIFDFDIPASDSGKTCTLVFLFPEQSELETSSFTFSGDGKVDFEELSAAATESTTYNNAPSVAADLGEFTIAPGNSYVISTFACPAGERVAYEIKEAGTTSLTYFQDYNPSPIGLYITTC